LIVLPRLWKEYRNLQELNKAFRINNEECRPFRTIRWYRLGKERWKLIRIIKDGKFSFTDTDDETTVSVDVSDYKIVDDNWWSFLVSKNINRSIEITDEAHPK